MHRYTLVTVAIFVTASAHLGTSQEDEKLNFEEATPISPVTPSYNESDTEEIPQKAPVEIQLILPPDLNNENGRYGLQVPDPNMGRPNDGSYGGSDATGVYGWRIPGMGGSFGGPNQNGGPYGPSNSMGPEPYGPPGPMGPNGWKGPIGGYNRGPGFTGGVNGWEGANMGGYGGRGSRRDGKRNGRRGGRRNGRRGGRRGEPCGPSGWCPYGGNSGNDGYGGPFDMGGYGYGYGRGNSRGQGFGGF